MGFTILGKRKRPSNEQQPKHPYLHGNFAPIEKTCPLTPCSYTGHIPEELFGGEYVRNGSNPVSNQDLGRDAHWFDGDGMLSGVLFRRQDDAEGKVQPEFVNQYILTDVFMSATSTSSLRKPIIPSIATLVNPFSTLLAICWSILRAFFIIMLSRMPGSKQVIKKISVANTSVMYHDGRALATCESGPPLRIALPSLDTVGWFNGRHAEGEPLSERNEDERVLGGKGVLAWMKEWTTAHPKVDPQTNEMILFHSIFVKPYVYYSVLPATKDVSEKQIPDPRLVNAPVSGVSSAKMMHDFGVSSHHTVIMDLPLSLDPLQLVKNRPPICYDGKGKSRFGVFPRHEPSNVRWFETSACCIFHTANTWDVYTDLSELRSVDMLACRMTSASVVFNAGNIRAPASVSGSKLKETKPKTIGEDVSSYERLPLLEADPEDTERDRRRRRRPTLIRDNSVVEDQQCRLYYYSFDMRDVETNSIDHQFALSAIDFEFPSVRDDRSMSSTRYVYGCSTTNGVFNSSLGRTARVDALVKFDVHTLIARGKRKRLGKTDCVDIRSVLDILASDDTHCGPIQIFRTPENQCAQEPRFVPKASGRGEDEGYLLAYMFDEGQLAADGEPLDSAVSELWIIDAQGMKDVLARVHLPQRVPYGLHGNWFPERQILDQRPIESVRRVAQEDESSESRIVRFSRNATNRIISTVGG